MIKHIVMWTLKARAEGADGEENARAMKMMLEGLAGKIPGLRHIEVGLHIVRSSLPCQVVLYSELESEEALQEYQQHPEHLRCVEFVQKVVAERNVLDYAVD